MEKIDLMFSEIIEILHLDEIAPIHLQTKEELSKENYVFCRCISYEEAEAMSNETYDASKEYDKSDMGVYLPDISVDEYYNLEMKRNPFNINSVMSEIAKDKIVWIKEYSLLVGIYTVLHEVGHWIYFIGSNKTGPEFSMIEKEHRSKLCELREQIYSMNDYLPQKRVLAEEFNRRYRDIPSEKAADKYAFSNFWNALDAIRKALQYTEEDLM